MKVSTQRIYTEDSIELFGLLYEPDEASQTVLVHVHGMAGNFYENKFLDNMAETLTGNGIAFFTFNNRGCELMKDLYRIEDGKKKIVRIGDAYERFEDSLLDISAAVRFVKDRGYTSVHLSGHSLGSPKSAYYASQKGNDELSSVILISPSDMVGLALVEKNRDWEIQTVEKMIEEGRGGELIPKPVWWSCYLTADTFINLSDKNGKVAIFNFYDKEDKLEVLGKIKVPIFSVMGRRDDALTVSIEETMERIKAASSNSRLVETEILGDATHGYVGYEQDLADKILAWIKRVS